jgi:hypothetical protein
MVSMKKGELYTVGVAFTIDPQAGPPKNVLHEALIAMRSMSIEAPTSEVAEHYADVVMRALMEAADED